MRIGVLPAGHRELECQHAAFVEAGSDTLQFEEAANQKSRSDEEDDRERELDNDEKTTEIVAPSPHGAAGP